MIRIEGLRHHLINIPELTLKGGKTAVIGRNGAGKTTFLELLAGIDAPWKGSVLLDGRPPRDLRIGWVGEFPDHTMLFSRVYDEVSSSLRFTRVPVPEADRRVHDTLESLQALHLLSRTTAELSGGEKALVAFAAALVNSPHVLILDEVDSHLDEVYAERIWGSLFMDERQTVFSTQDMELASKADEVVLLQGGEVLRHGSPQEVFSADEDSCLYPNLWRLRE